MTENTFEKTDPKPIADVRLEKVAFSYMSLEAGSVTALAGVSLSLPRGGYVALLGKNGSGKSTMAKLINVLEMPESGAVYVLGRNTRDESHFWEIRRSCGMVFQNPDNQIVGTTVEEDVAFGPENLGVPTDEIRRRVDASLRYVGLQDYALRQPSQLSGGQKQKLAIAGILAMQPQILLLDESTSMLDPISRDEFLAVVSRLIREKHLTVLHITHDMSEACLADYVYVLNQGRIALQGTPGEVFSQVETVRSLGLDVPVYAEIAYEVAARLGYDIEKSSLYTRVSAIEGIRKMLASVSDGSCCPEFMERLPEVAEPSGRVVMRVSDLSHTYEKKNAPALSNVSFDVCEGEIFAVIGHSGSGKTTLITHLNGLMRPESGEVVIYPSGGAEALDTRKNADVRKIRRTVGLLFQYPEYQLFEETVEKDVAFGPTKMGLPEEEVGRRVRSAIQLVGLEESLLQRSPFELSGGQKRRVAFAGVLAMDPDILVLDEPAAGLDPTGRREILHYAEQLKKRGKTIILVSHNMDEAARYADRILVLKNGTAAGPMTPRELFSDEERLGELSLRSPETISCLRELRNDYPDINTCLFTTDEAADELIRAAAGKAADARDGGQGDQSL